MKRVYYFYLAELDRYADRLIELGGADRLIDGIVSIRGGIQGLSDYQRIREQIKERIDREEGIDFDIGSLLIKRLTRM